MALEIEDGTGKSNADSYLSVADADTYNTNHDNSSTWNAADVPTKEKALRLSTQYLDTKYFPRWVGSQGTKEQALNWPRINGRNRNGFAIDSDEIPNELKDATAEMAFKSLAGDIFNEDQTSTAKKTKEKKKVGPLEKEIEYQSGVSPTKIYQKVDSILRGILKAGGLSVIRN